MLQMNIMVHLVKSLALLVVKIFLTLLNMALYFPNQRRRLLFQSVLTDAIQPLKLRRKQREKVAAPGRSPAWAA